MSLQSEVELLKIKQNKLIKKGKIDFYLPIRGGNDFDVIGRSKTVQLIQKFEHGSLHLSISTQLAIETFGTCLFFFLKKRIIKLIKYNKI